MVPAPPCGRPEPTLPKVMNCVSVQLGRVCGSGRELSAPGACRHLCVQKPRVAPISLPDCTGEGPRAEKAYERIGACPIGRIFEVIQFITPLAICGGKWRPREAEGPESQISQELMWENTQRPAPSSELPRGVASACFMGFSLLLFSPALGQ